LMDIVMPGVKTGHSGDPSLGEGPRHPRVQADDYWRLSKGQESDRVWGWERRQAQLTIWSSRSPPETLVQKHSPRSRDNPAWPRCKTCERRGTRPYEPGCAVERRRLGGLPAVDERVKAADGWERPSGLGPESSSRAP
jgi:hypothetical protein